ncbi:MAG: transketolase [Acholeplasmataceae bacterium]|jgi:transketolase
MLNHKDGVNAVRFLGVDAINKANSGHPGIVLGAAPMAYSLFINELKINPKNSKWMDRDRFVLSAGHGSGLLYALNHLSGFNISLDDLKNFRQIGNTPGHPEYGHTDGVETTSGPLGQGISNAVGMAIAESHLAARFNKPNFDVVNHYTYVLCGDGDLQEGVALEACSLAGHLRLNKLIVLFDSNDIQLDGPTSLATSDNIAEKFQAMNWHYQLVEDGENLEIIHQAIMKAKANLDKPSLIEVKTVIGHGVSYQGTSKTHGSPIGDKEREYAAEKLGWEYAPFEIPTHVYEIFKKNVLSRGRILNQAHNNLLEDYAREYPNEHQELMMFMSGEVKLNYKKYQKLITKSKDATRNVSGIVLNQLQKEYKNIIGGSADLTGSTKAKGADGDFTKDNRLGRNINYGVREHAMAAINNGIALHGGLKVFAGAFFVFSDYCKPSIRLSALMGLPVTYVFTHDTVAVGEDGPTHQPIEQLAGLRAIPNLNVLRPADANETIASWKIAIESESVPTVLVLTRQNVTNLVNTSLEGVKKGAYVVSPEKDRLDGVLLAAGSEVGLAVEAQALLLKKGVDVRVVSMPSHFLFAKKPKGYQDEVLPNVPTLAIEAGSTMSWYQFTPHVMGIDQFGVSCPGGQAMEHFKFTAPEVVKRFLKLIK